MTWVQDVVSLGRHDCARNRQHRASALFQPLVSDLARDLKRRSRGEITGDSFGSNAFNSVRIDANSETDARDRPRVRMWRVNDHLEDGQREMSGAVDGPESGRGPASPERSRTVAGLGREAVSGF